MRKLLLLILISNIFIFSQENKKEPNVELPDFVIYGNEKINVQKNDKIQPVYIPVISDEFIYPVISPEEAGFVENNKIEAKNLQLHDSVKIIRNNFNINVSYYNLPTAEYILQQPFHSGYFQADVLGSNVRPYVDNADRYLIKANLKYAGFTDKESSFLPSSSNNLDAGISALDYKIYNNSFIVEKRKLNEGNLSYELKNLSTQTFYYVFSANDNFSQINQEDFSENNFNVNVLGKYKLPNFAIGASLKLASQNGSNSTQKINTTFGNINSVISFTIEDYIKADFGFNYSLNQQQNYFDPYATLGIKMDNHLSIVAELAPSAQLLTNNDILKMNEFFDVDKLSTIVVRKNIAVSGFVKYEYEKILEVNAGIRYNSYSNLPYFVFNDTSKFNLNFTKANQIQFEANAIFNTKDFGSLFGNIVISSTKDSIDRKIPYFEGFKLKGGYEYNFGLILLGTNINYKNNIYKDIANKNSLPNYFDAEVYSSIFFNNYINLNFRVNNLFNKKNYNWENYREMPFDLMAGLSIRW